MYGAYSYATVEYGSRNEGTGQDIISELIDERTILPYELQDFAPPTAIVTPYC